MPRFWLARRRLVSQRWLVVAEIATVAFAAGVLVGGQVYLAGGSTAVVSGSLERAAPAAKNIDIRLLAPPGFELAAADREIVRATRPLPRPELAARMVSPVFRVGAGAAPSVNAVLLYEEGVAPVGLVSGTYPRAADEVVAPAGFLAGLRLRVGDSLRLTYRGAVTVRIVGSYDSLAAGSARFATAGAFGAGQPAALIVAPTGLRRDLPALGITSGASVSWLVGFDDSHVSLSELRHLVGLHAAVERDIAGSPGLSSASVSWGIGSLVSPANRAVAASAAAVWVVVFEVTLLALLIVAAVAVLRVRRRSFETAILAARGARLRDLAVIEGVEALVVTAFAVPGAVAVGLAMAALGRAAHGPGVASGGFPLPMSGETVLVAVAGVAAAVSGLVAFSLVGVRRGVMVERQRRFRTGQALHRVPWDIVVLGVGIAALVELRQSGITSATGAGDPVAVAAPALLLVGSALLARRIVVWVIQAAARSDSVNGSPAAFLALRRVTRSPVTVAVSSLLILALGLFVESDSLRTSVLAANTRAARGEVGADWNVFTSDPSSPVWTASRLQPAATLRYDGTINGSSAPSLRFGDAVGVDPRTAQQDGWWSDAAGSGALHSALAQLEHAPIGILLPPTTTGVSARVWSARTLPGVGLIAVVEGQNGRVADRPLGYIRRGSHVYQARIPAGRLLSLAARAPQALPPRLSKLRHTELAFGSLTITGRQEVATVLETTTWQPVSVFNVITPRPRTTALGRELALPLLTGGVLGGIQPRSPPLPVLVSAVGGVPARFNVQVGTLEIPVRAVGAVSSVPEIPAGQPALVAPIDELMLRFAQAVQRPNGGTFSVLSMGPNDPRGRIRQAGLVTYTTRRARTVEAQLAADPQSLALGIQDAAAVFAIVFAVIAVALVLVYSAKAREHERATFDAFGGPRRTLKASIALEWAVLFTSSLAFGLAIGTCILLLVAPALSLAIPHSAGVVTASIGWRDIAAALVALAVPCVVAILIATHISTRRASAHVLRDEAA